MQQVFDSVIRSCLEGRFSDFITDDTDANTYPMGKTVASHNRKVLDVLQVLGIDTDKWFGYNRQDSFTLGQAADKVSSIEAAIKEFADMFSNLLNLLDDKKIQAMQRVLTDNNISIDKSSNQISLLKNGKPIDKNDIYSQLNGLSQDNLHTSLKKMLGYFNNRYQQVQEVKTAIGHLTNAIDRLKQLQGDSKAEEKLLRQTRGLAVRLWQRNPGRDIFQGNFTSCCVAIDNNLHPEAIVEYLIDKGIQVVEVVDEATDRTIAQAWVFVAYDKDKKPVLAIDNIEVDNNYPRGTEDNNTIRDKLIAYIKDYAKEIGAKGIYLGMTQYNDVDTTGFKKVPNKLRKAGGYAWDFEKEGYSYYLESFFGESTGPYTITSDGSIAPTIEKIYKISFDAFAHAYPQETPTLAPEPAGASFSERVVSLDDLDENGARKITYYQGIILYAKDGTMYILSVGHGAEQGDKVTGYYQKIPFNGVIIGFDLDEKGRDISLIEVTGIDKKINIPPLPVGYPPLGSRFKAGISFVDYSQIGQDISQGHSNINSVLADANVYKYEPYTVNTIEIDAGDTQLDQWGICGAAVFYDNKLVGIINKADENICYASTGNFILSFLRKTEYAGILALYREGTSALAAGKSKLVVTDNIEFYLGALRLKREFENVQIIPFKVPVAASKKELDNILKELKNIYNPNEVYIYLNNSVKADDLIAGGIEAKALKGDPKTALQTLEAV